MILRGNFAIDTKDIDRLPTDIRDRFAKLNLIGVIYGSELFFKGSLDKWKEWDLTFKASAPNFRIYDYPFKNVLWSYQQRDHNISTCDVTASIYDGNLSIKSNTSLLSKDMPARITAILGSLDLEQLRKDKKLKMMDLKGKLTINSSLVVPLGNPDKTTGEGSFATKDGYIGEIAIIKGVLSAINKVPGALGAILDDFTRIPTDKISQETSNHITDVSGDFQIGNKIMTSDDIVLFGSLYDLIIRGSIDFQMNVTAIVSPDYTRFAGNNRLPTEFIGSPIQVSITGTVQNPSFKPIVNPKKTLKSVVDAPIEVLKGVGDIFGDLLGN